MYVEKFKTKMLYVEHKKIFYKKFKINFKSNIYFVLPHYTRGPVNRSLQPTKSHAQICN